MSEVDRLQTIGEVARGAGIATSTLRYYEQENILAPAGRSRSGYRLYDRHAVERLGFIRAAQAVGFTLDDVRALLKLDGNPPCKPVRAMIERRLAEVDTRLTDLKRVRTALAEALKRCRKSRRGCAVVADLKRVSGNGRSR